MHIDPYCLSLAVAPMVMHMHYIEHNGRAHFPGIVSNTSYGNPETILYILSIEFASVDRNGVRVFQLLGHSMDAYMDDWDR